VCRHQRPHQRLPQRRQRHTQWRVHHQRHSVRPAGVAEVQVGVQPGGAVAEDVACECADARGVSLARGKVGGLAAELTSSDSSGRGVS
jgi:hypothetical protein